MDEKLQQYIAFHLTGRRDGTGLVPLNGKYRPALFARYADLTALRYDFPLILNSKGAPERAVLSLSRLIDNVIAAMTNDPIRDRVARHGYEIEREIRHILSADGHGDLRAVWDTAVEKLVTQDESIKISASRLWAELFAVGKIVDVDADLPASFTRHIWSAVQRAKALSFHEKADRMLFKLRNILEAEMQGSPAGRSAERLRAGVGMSFGGTFDFDVLSRVLNESKPAVRLSEDRRERIRNLIEVLERQRFFPIEAGIPAYDFAFDNCGDALDAYQSRHSESIAVLKALAVAELETNGEYRDSVHDTIFEGFGEGGLDADQLAVLPDYLVVANSAALDPSEASLLTELLSSGLPFKILVQTDDILESSSVAEGHFGLGAFSRQLVQVAIGQTDVFVVQTAASNLFSMGESILRGIEYDGAMLLSVFSGANSHTSDLPPYLVAAAAAESRAFPTLVYNPSAGADWLARFAIDTNPSAESEWPEYALEYEDSSLQSQIESIAFTFADLVAMDQRFASHFALAPAAELADHMISVPDAINADTKGMPTKIPAIALIDDEFRLTRAVADDRILRETRRCLSMWRSQQELGGIHNSFVNKLVAQGYKPAIESPSPPAAEALAAVAAAEAEPAPQPESEATSAEVDTDEPYIETARCTSCNECTQINNKMFAYNTDKQAYIADADAGTFRQLVEAAEGCQVSIIHPGNPRNPKEPGLEDLIIRAAAFN